jgi:hypothetical protein
MARPRKPEDPDKYLPCDRCGKCYWPAAWWPEGLICGNCYQAAKRTTGTCPCGHEGVLPGIVDGTPVCRGCSGIILNVDCVECGAETELYRGGSCLRCILKYTAFDLLRSPDTGEVDPKLAAVVDALGTMERPNSGLTWIQQPHVAQFLKQLAAQKEITHESVDALPQGRTTNYVRALLVEHGVLPVRDELLARFEVWSIDKQGRVIDPEQQIVIDQFRRWGLLRHLRSCSPITNSAFLRAKQSFTVAIEFCNWLTLERGLTVTQFGQHELDAWQAGGTSTRGHVYRFIRWAIATRIVPADLTVVPHRRGTAARLDAQSQTAAVEQVVYAGDLTDRDRLAAILIIVFGQRAEKICRLTWQDIIVTDTDVILHLGSYPITLPPPLDEPVRVLGNIHGQTAAHPNSPWVFRGYTPGNHLDPAHLRLRLKPLFAALAARLGTLTELTKTTPVAILAETLGYHPATLEAHAKVGATVFAEYIALRD